MRHDLVVRAPELTRMLHALLPRPEVARLLALIVLTEASRATRVGADGRLLLLLEEQNRSRWDRVGIDEGLALVRVAPQAGAPGRNALQAAIAAMHADAATWAETDRREFVALYGLLEARWG